MKARSDAELRALTGLFRERLARGEPAEALLPEALAAVREAAARAIGERPSDEQVMGGAALHLGMAAEMRDGEGKTLTATIAAYLYALPGEPVHVMTANDYLARRDAQRMAPVYRHLGLEAGVILPETVPEERKCQYAADVTYGTCAEFCFDYLRDNMAWSADEHVQRGQHVAIVDDAGLTLIDKARMPLSILGPAGEAEGRITLAETTVHDYLLLYRRLAALAGVAATDSGDYRGAYGMEVMSIPARRPVIRIDHLDAVYADARAKLNAIAAEVAARHAAGQPVLIGTSSAGQSGAVAALLSQRGIAHEVLSARDDQRDARVLAEAGRPGAVTIVTEVAGLGAGIRLGGADGTARDTVASLGGLCVLGAEHHWLRRQDAQLRDRAGRCGDPGESTFFFSPDDDLVARFFAPKAAAQTRRWVKEGAARAITQGIDGAQAAFQARYARSLLYGLEYDAVLARQQRALYADRQALLRGDGPQDMRRMIDEVVRDYVLAAQSPADARLWRDLRALYPVRVTPGALAADRGCAPERLPASFAIERICADARAAYDRRTAELGADIMRDVESRVLLSVTDRQWHAHLRRMHELIDGLSHRDPGEGDPLAEYRDEAARAFAALRREGRERVVGALFNLEIEVLDAGQQESRD